MRTAAIARKTNETDIKITLNLDGVGDAKSSTGVGFFDHMIAALAKFARFNIELDCKGDLQVDEHHTVEDCGIALGEAIAQALSDKRGITRTAHAYVPMDEALAFCALDISGRGMLAFVGSLPREMIGGMNAQLAQEFFRALASKAGITLHMSVTGKNAHHMVEALFKAAGLALGNATALDPRISGIVPSTKGVL
ncbi:MAG: imidazoleglycerol-phosphate dehydratase HisB [Oscillospiraceae bacterium]|jgi:imidazoleglycerol-phosphate dehydratase|nr:imidazoleglycerol-phosphate dehydratase HisB [Oscillospiraceae bacterium]